MRKGDRDPRLPTRVTAFLFDLDGTLIDSEPLKTRAHVLAVQELSTAAVPAEAEIEEAVNHLIGVPTPETANELIARFGLESQTSARQWALGLSAPWQAYSSVHDRHYERIVDEAGVLQQAQLPFAVALLKAARSRGLRTALGSMSFRYQVEHTLAILGWERWFEVAITGDEVSRGKPDPEIYLRLAATLQVSPRECLVLEDSPSGISAALAAGMACIAVPHELTREAVLSMKELDQACLVLDPAYEVLHIERWLPEPARAANKTMGV